MTVTFSAGNEGIDANGDGGVDDDSIGSPATAKNVISVGASENDRGLELPLRRHQERRLRRQWRPEPHLHLVGELALRLPGRAPEERSERRQRRADGRLLEPRPDRRRADQARRGGAGHVGALRLLRPLPGGLRRVAQSPERPLPVRRLGIPAERQAQVPRRHVDGEPARGGRRRGGARLLPAAPRPLRERGAREGHARQLRARPARREQRRRSTTTTSPIPNISEGWGRVDLAAATDGSREFVDDDDGPRDGRRREPSPTTSPAGHPSRSPSRGRTTRAIRSATKMLVNDLDLEVSGPGGAFYRGNVFAGGWSVAGGLADNTNNVENVYVQSPAAGQWTVTVRGFNVPQGPQPFALRSSRASWRPARRSTLELTVTPPGERHPDLDRRLHHLRDRRRRLQSCLRRGILRHVGRHARLGIRARGLDGRLRRSRRDLPPVDEPGAPRRRQLRAEPRLAVDRRRQRRRGRLREPPSAGVDRVAVRSHERARDRRLRHGRRNGRRRQRLRRRERATSASRPDRRAGRSA